MDTRKKKLQVKIGPSINCLKISRVNDDKDPHFIDSPYFTGNLVVRIKDFNGITPDGKRPTGNETYFQNRKRMFALQVSGRFKHEYFLDDIMFGAEFERKVIPPTGSWIAMKFANLIDPALEADLFVDKPWFYSPIFCSMNIVNVKRADSKVVGAAPSVHKSLDLGSKKSSKASLNNLDEPLKIETADPNFQPKDEQFTSALVSEYQDSKSLKSMLPSWSWGPSAELTEDNALLHREPVEFATDDSAERRKYFQKEKVRKSTIISPSNVYNFEIYAPFIDLNSFDLSLGLNVNILQYLNNQPIRMMAKSKSTNKFFFVIQFDLVEDHIAQDYSLAI